MERDGFQSSGGEGTGTKGVRVGAKPGGSEGDLAFRSGRH